MIYVTASNENMLYRIFDMVLLEAGIPLESRDIFTVRILPDHDHIRNLLQYEHQELMEIFDPYIDSLDEKLWDLWKIDIPGIMFKMSQAELDRIIEYSTVNEDIRPSVYFVESKRNGPMDELSAALLNMYYVDEVEEY